MKFKNIFLNLDNLEELTIFYKSAIILIVKQVGVSLKVQNLKEGYESEIIFCTQNKGMSIVNDDDEFHN
jgi:hypothetical protein